MHVHVCKFWIYCGLPWKLGCPEILPQPILGTQFLNPGLHPASRHEQVNISCFTLHQHCLIACESWKSLHKDTRTHVKWTVLMGWIFNDPQVYWLEYDSATGGKGPNIVADSDTERTPHCGGKEQRPSWFTTAAIYQIVGEYAAI